MSALDALRARLAESRAWFFAHDHVVYDNAPTSRLLWSSALLFPVFAQRNAAPTCCWSLLALLSTTTLAILESELRVGSGGYVPATPVPTLASPDADLLRAAHVAAPSAAPSLPLPPLLLNGSAPACAPRYLPWAFEFSHLVYLCMVVYFLGRMYLSVLMQHRLYRSRGIEIDLDDAGSESMLVLPRILWVAHSFALPLSVVVLVMVLAWGASATPGIALAFHGLNMSVMLVDAMFWNVPLLMIHLTWLLLFEAVYAVFVLAVYAVFWRGRSCPYAHPAVDWSRPRDTLFYILLVAQLTALVYAVLVAFTYLRKRAFRTPDFRTSTLNPVLGGTRGVAAFGGAGDVTGA